MNEIIKVNENGPMALKGTLSADMNKNKDINIFEYYPELNTLKNEFRDLILNDDSITPE